MPNRVVTEEQLVHVEQPDTDLAAVALTDVLKAVADPVRLQIVKVLATGGPATKSETDWGCEALSRATMSHHFKILREAGLTSTVVHGRTQTVRLRCEELEKHFPGLIPSIAP